MKPSKTYLGKLCARKHDYNQTGKSLRYEANKVCRECQREVMQRKGHKYKLQQEINLLKQENASLKHQQSKQTEPVFYVSVVHDADIPLAIATIAELQGGTLVVNKEKQLGANSYAVFAFTNSEKAIQFQNNAKLKVLLTSNPSISSQVSITDFN